MNNIGPKVIGIAVALLLLVGIFSYGMYLGYKMGYDKGLKHYQTISETCKNYPGSCEGGGSPSQSDIDNGILRPRRQ